MTAGVQIVALPGLPIAAPGDDLAELIAAGLDRARLELRDGDVVVVTSKLISRIEDRFVELAAVTTSARAHDLAAITGKDPRLVELILRESTAVSRAAPGVLIVRHRLGFVSANAAIDASNTRADGGASVLLLPVDPDRSARGLREALRARTGATVGVVISDSHGRPFRDGAIGVAVGVAGVPALVDQRGRPDLFGRALEHTFTALGDQLASAAELVTGQADEALPVVVIRGVPFTPGEHTARELVRDPEKDLYA